MRLLSLIGYVLDRLDVGGWLLLLSGGAIVAATVLVPTWRDVLEMQAQVDQLQLRLDLLQRQKENYEAFKREYEAGNPLLMQRLAWQQLRLKPSEANLLDVPQFEAGPLPEPASINRWVQPLDIVNSPAYHGTDPLRDAPFIRSRLADLLTGPRRPYVLAFGGMLILFSLVLNPTPRCDEESDDDPADDAMGDDRLHYADAD